MHGVESSTNAPRAVHATQEQRGPSPVGAGKNTVRESLEFNQRGALNLARERIEEVLASTGFVSITGAQQVNFETFLEREPVDLAMDDLKPGMLPELAAWIAQEIAGDPGHALEIQARVRPEAALRLLA